MPMYRITPDRGRPSGWPILSFADIEFFVEPSFLIFAGIIFFGALQSGGGSFTQAGLLIFIIFFSLLLHEGGHALVARLFGHRPITVSLIMFGGQTQHPPATRGQNLLITLAGPLCTVAIAVVAWLLLSRVPAIQASDPSRYLLRTVMALNLFWAAFNLLPIYPMDGGQALLYGLAFLMNERRAWLSVALVSMGVCILAALGLYQLGWGSMFTFLFIFMFFWQNLQIFRTLSR